MPPFFACFRMTPYALEYQVGEQRNGCGIYYLKPVHPFGVFAASAVRYKFAFVSGIQVAVYRLKYAYFEGYTNVCQLVCISQERGSYLA